MSRVYFHSPSRIAELRGYEFYWLQHLAGGPAKAAWDLDGDALDRACALLELVPEVPDNGSGSNFLHVFWREAVEQDRRNKEIYSARAPGALLGHSGANHAPIRRFIESLKTSLAVYGLDLDLFGVRLRTINLDLNTALVAGSDPVALAAKIHGWCDKHPWVEGPDRAWLADVIEQGLKSGLYRRGAGWDQPVDEHDEGPGVIPMLRARDDEPVVLSHSTYNSFPNSSLGDWMPPWPEGVERRWEALTGDQQDQRTQREEEWYELPDERRWEIAMAGLRAERPWARLSADTLRTETFHLPVTVYDVTASDRDERLRAVLSGEPGYREPVAADAT
jgi:hypothetical protein